MKRRLMELIHSITLRMPQRIALRNGLRITTYGRRSNSLFWSMFTSSEYLSLVPYLVRLKTQPVVCIDCGAALGYFSLLTEHLIRSGVLPWKPLRFILLEPMPLNFKRLQYNVEGNLSSYELHQRVAGKKDGNETFYFNKLMPWSGTVFGAGKFMTGISVEHQDLTAALSKDLCIIKLDIEGSEFAFIDNYLNNLEKVVAIVIEWHLERGNREHAMELMTSKGFKVVKQSLNKDNRVVELLVNQAFYP